MDTFTEGLKKKYQQLSFKAVQSEISTSIAYDEAYNLKALLHLFGDQLSQDQKNNYLLYCYARPYSAPLLLELGANANVHCECRCISSALSGLPNSCKKYSILHEAAERGNPGVVQALLEYNAKVDELDKNTQETPLMKACRIKAIDYSRGDKRHLGNYVYLIIKLIEAGADLKLINKAGNTALQIAQTEIPDPKRQQCVVNLLSCQKIK